MAMSKSISMGSTVIGCTLLVLTLISVICGGVAVSQVSSPTEVTVGLWGLYFAIPGVLSIVAGRGKLSSMLGGALGTHILGIILAISGFANAAILWAILSSCGDRSLESSFKGSPDYCVCTYWTTKSAYKFEASCSDMEIVRDATGVVTIVFGILAIVSFVGSIYGCIGTCCASREPVPFVATSVPVHGNNVVITTY